MDRLPVKVNIIGLSCGPGDVKKTEPMSVSAVLSEVQVVTEADWQRRLSHRRAVVSYVKSTWEYKASAANSSRPPTPNPEDRNVSKRMWEKSIQTWRRDLKDLVSFSDRDASWTCTRDLSSIFAPTSMESTRCVYDKYMHK